MSSNIEIKKKCKWCGQIFIAHKTTTNYCSHRCNNAAYKERIRQERIASYQKEFSMSAEESSVEDKEFYTPPEAAKLLGISRASIYRYMADNVIKAVQFKGKTLVRRKDIELLFENAAEYKKRVPIEKAPITDFYTTAEVKEKYHVNESWIFKVGKEQNIPKVFKRGKTYWSAKHFDKYFASKAPDSNITEWYSVEDLTEKFGMTTSAIYSFVSRFAIPKKKIKRQVFYSQKHVDIAKGLAKAEPEYYTTAEAMEKYNLTRDQLYHYVKWHHISKVQEGKYIKISRKELDDLLAPPSI